MLLFTYGNTLNQVLSLKIALTCTLATLKDQATALAAQLRIPLVAIDNKDHEFLLVLTAERLELRQISIDAAGPMYVDFLAGKIAYRQAHRGKELLAKAVGIKGNYQPSVIDATAGLGSDSFILASLGCKITMLERSPIMAALLQDGLVRALKNPQLAEKLALILINIDAINYFAQLKPEQFPDVTYLDPMHPPRTKTALVKKEMRMIRAIVGEDIDSNVLLTNALQCAKKRVVVKRPRLAPSLTELKPSFVIMGKQQRFDVYLV